MDARLLEMFLRVAEAGSINRAAGLLHVSQPALSRHIAALEHEMGTALFVRSQGGVHLTEPGRLLADRARPLLRQFAQLKEEVGDTAAGQLSIGIPPSWRRVFTTAFLQTLLAERPGIKLRVHEGVSHALRDLLLGGSLDLGMVPFDPGMATGLAQTPVVREPIIVVGPSRAGFRPDQPVALGRLADLALVLPARPNVLRQQVEQGLLRRQLTPRVVVETDNLLLCLDLARDGVGVTAVPACALSGTPGAADTQGLSWAPLRGLSLTWSMYENTVRSHALPVREARRHALQILRTTLADRQWFGAEAMPGLAPAAGVPPASAAP